MASQPTMNVIEVIGRYLRSLPVEPHVLLVAHRRDDGSGTEEQQGLEEGVGDHVEHAGHERTRADREEHVPELGDRGVGQHLLDVVLSHRRERGNQRRGQTDPRDHVVRPTGLGQQWIEPRRQEDARGDHRGRVDESRDGRRTGHGIGQPDEQRQLGRLAGRREEEQQHDRGGGHTRYLTVGQHSDIGVVDRAESHPHEERPEHEPHVADSVGHEGLLAGSGVGLVGEPEADQQVGAGTDALPTEEGEHQVVGHHQDQHRGDECVQVDEELREVLVAGHVADRIEVDQRADAGDEQRHGDRKRVGHEPDVDTEATGGEPGEQRWCAAPAARHPDRPVRRTRRVMPRRNR